MAPLGHWVAVFIYMTRPMPVEHAAEAFLAQAAFVTYVGATDVITCLSRDERNVGCRVGGPVC